jgi:hypothetical protein
MPIAKKLTNTSKPFSRAEIAAAKAAASEVRATEEPTNWSVGVVTRGGGVATTVASIRKTRGPNRRPTKEQVALRLDPEVIGAFRAGGPGWQTRMNAALKDWLATHSVKPRGKSRGAA